MRFRDFGSSDRDGCRAEIARYIELAAKVVDIHRGKFDNPDSLVLDDPLEDVLQAHYACYIDNCAVGSYLARRYGCCDYVAGYSMGVFSALHHCGAFSFQDGLLLMQRICTCAHQAVGEGEFGMGVVVGLSVDEIGQWLGERAPGVEIADICGPRVVVFSGEISDVEQVLDVAVSQGALQAKLTPVRLPFHSSRLKRIASDVRDLVERVTLREPRYKVVSCMTQSLLATEDDVRREIVLNVSHPINWYQTMQRLLSFGVDTFLECGMSESLRNLAKRNIKGKYSIYTPRQFENVFAAAG